MPSESTRFTIMLAVVLCLGLLYGWLTDHEKKPKPPKPETKVSVTVKCECAKGESHVIQGTVPNVLSNISSIRR